MLIGIHDTGATCALTVTENHNSSALPLPISSTELRGSLESLLMDPSKDQLESGPVQFVRQETGIAVICKAGSFSIHWRYLYWLVEWKITHV